MNTLITPAQVVRLAFPSESCLPPDLVAEADIAAAAQRYLVPVIGLPLYERLMADTDRSFVDHYLAAPLALFTRLMIQPRLDICAGRTGTTAPKYDGTTPATEEARRMQRRSLRTEARALLQRAVARIEAYPETYPEYDPKENILKRCSLDGKLVQIH